MSLKSDDLGLIIGKSFVNGCKSWNTRSDIPGILFLSAGCYLLKIPPIIAPPIYLTVKGLIFGPKINKYDGYAVLEKKEDVYTVKSYIPYDELIKKRNHIEHSLNTDIVRFEQKKTDKTIIYIITKKGLKTQAENKILSVLSDFNPVPLPIKENEYLKTFSYTLDGSFKALISQLDIIKNYLGADYIILHYPKIDIKFKKPEKIRVLPDHINKAKIGFIIGFNIHTGEVYSFSWDEAVHVLVAGKTGSGKSVLDHCIITSAMYYDNDMAWLMFDPKKVELSRYEMFSNVAYTDNMNDFRVKIKKALSLMEYRYTVMKKQGITDYTGKKLIIVIDEMSFIKNVLQDKDDISPILIRVLNEGRAAGIHMLLSTQRPQVKQMDTNLREPMPTKIGLQMSSKDGKNFMEIDGLDGLIRGNGKVKADSRRLAHVQILFHKENQFNDVYNALLSHHNKKVCLAKIQGGIRKLKPVSNEVLSVIDYIEDSTSLHYKPVKSIHQRFVETLDRQKTMPDKAKQIQELGLENDPRKLRELKEWGLQAGILGKKNKVTYTLNQDEIKKYLKTTETY